MPRLIDAVGTVEYSAEEMLAVEMHLIKHWLELLEHPEILSCIVLSAPAKPVMKRILEHNLRCMMKTLEARQSAEPASGADAGAATSANRGS